MAVYTHGHHESVVSTHRRRTALNSAQYLLPHLAPGMQLLDVGSGPATITADFADLLGSPSVSALELTDEAMKLTRDELSARGHAASKVHQGSVMDLPLEDASFDVVHAHQVLQHLDDPVRAIQEMMRVCKPGGIVAVRDAIYSSFAWAPASRAIESWLDLYLGVARANGGEPDAGKHLHQWASQAGAQRVECSSSNWLFAGADGAWWGDAWSKRILQSEVASSALRHGLANQAELDDLSDGWRKWSQEPDVWFLLVHAEVLIWV